MNKKIIEYLCDFAAKHPDVKMSYTSVPAPVEPEKHNWVPTIGLIFLFVMLGAEYIRTAWM
jgi:hypothetical protein